MAKEKICKYCEHSYDMDSEKKVRCVYHDKYPKPSDCCGDWKERSDELINRQMAKQAVVDAESILLAFAMVGRLPAVEAVTSVDRPQGEWEEKTAFHNEDDNPIIEEWQSAKCSVCGKYHTTPYLYYFDDFNYCPNCGARMKGDTNGRL